jgi:hypothetical protein
MTDEQMNKLIKDLERIAKKHKITNYAFTGSGEERHIGILGKAEVNTFYETALNVGRLWQHTRTVMRERLDNFDKKIR